MNLMNARLSFNRPYEPPLATAEGPITLTEQARAFGEIRDWTEHGELDLEEALFHQLPVPPNTNTGVEMLFRSFAARSLSFLTEGQITVAWRRLNCRVTRQTAVFYERDLDCCFLKFNPKAEDSLSVELRIHTCTILDAREVLREWSEEDVDGERIDAAEFLLKARLLTGSKLLPDNSREAWDGYIASTPLVPDFEQLRKILVIS